MKKNLFLKRLFRQIRKIPYENPIFFPDNLFFFLLYTIITLVILNSDFGLTLTTPWPDEKDFF